MDMNQKVKRMIMECTLKEIDLEEIMENTNIYEDLEYDSVAIIELLTAIEDEFGVDFTELDDFEELLESYSGIVAGISELIRRRG